MSEPTSGGARVLSLSIAPEAANAIVYTIAFEIGAEAEGLDSLPVSSQPRDLLAISVRCARISRLAAINDQLGWRAQRDAADEPITLTATDVVLLELATRLEATAQDRIRFPDERLEHFPFDQAAEAIRAALRAAAH